MAFQIHYSPKKLFSKSFSKFLWLDLSDHSCWLISLDGRFSFAKSPEKGARLESLCILLYLLDFFLLVGLDFRIFLHQFLCLVSSLIFLRLFGLGLFDHSDLNFQISIISWAIWIEVSYFSRLLRNTQRSKWCVLDFLVPSSTMIIYISK